MSSAENSPLKARARNELKRRYFHRGYLWPWILVLLIPFVLRFVMFCDVTFPFASTPSTSEVVRPEELQWYKFPKGSPENVDIPIIHDGRINSANDRMTIDPSHGRTKNERSTRSHLPVAKRPDDHDAVNLNSEFLEEDEDNSFEAAVDMVHLRQIGKRIQVIRRWEHRDTRKAAEKMRDSEKQVANEESKDVGKGDEKIAEERGAAKEMEAADERRDVEEREAAKELMTPKERKAEEKTSVGQEKEADHQSNAEQEKEAEEERTVDEEREAGEKSGEVEKSAEDMTDGNESRNDEGKNQDAKQTHLEEKNSSEVEEQKTTTDEKQDERTARLEVPTEEGKHTEDQKQENGTEDKDKEQSVGDSDSKYRKYLTSPIDHTLGASLAGQCDVFEEACLGLPEDNEKIVMAEKQEEKEEEMQKEKQESYDDKQDENPMEMNEAVQRWTSGEQTTKDDRHEAQREEVAAEEQAEQQMELEERRDAEATEEKRAEEELKDAEGIEREMIEEQQNQAAEQEENGGSIIEEVTGLTKGEQPVEAKSSGECDLFDGDWVWDPEGPLYTNSTCFYMQLAQNCMSNGRPDIDYLYWKWKPRDCEFPRFDARAFLEAFRGRTIGFVGDSLARNQMQSLLCMLSQIEIPKLIYQSHDDSSVRWLFEQHQVILASVWSPYLLRESDEGIMGFEKGQSVLYLDELDTAWTSVMKDLDIVVLSIGQWYFKPSIYVNHEEVVGCYYCPGFNLTQMRYQEAYQLAVRQVLEKVALEFKGIAIMSTFAISHFEEGLWNNGGQCRREKPLDKEDAAKFPGLHNDMYDIVMSEFNSIASDKSNLNENVKLEFLDVTKVSLMRADGHPGPYRQPNPFDGKDSNEWVPNDCLHWCLPGPVDTWNQLLVKIVHRHL